MKKIFFAIIILLSATFAASCRKENNFNDAAYGPITISAVTEGIDNPATKASTAYKYDVLWGTGDQIIVKGQAGSDTFTLTAGAGTTAGTFQQDNSVALSGAVESFYPVSILDNGTLVWPSEQSGSPVPPMYCKKSITGKTEDFRFRSLGAMLQIVLTTTDADITLSGIRISDASKPLSGTFTVSDGKAVMNFSGKSGIVLNTGNVKIGNAAKYFNIAVPAGKYDNLKLTFFTNDSKGVAMYSTTMPEIQHNTVAKISLCAKNFKPVPTGFALEETAVSLPVGGHRKLQPQFTPADTYNKKLLWTSSNTGIATVGADGMVKAVSAGSATITAQLEDETLSASCDVTVTTPVTAPDGALDGLFSVSDNKVVRFAPSNLNKSGETYGFFDNQYTMAGEGQTELIKWSELQTWLSSAGGTGWQILSSDEWMYLFGDNQFRKGLYAKHVKVIGVEDCLIIYPDGYTGTKVTDENRMTLYADSDIWTQAQDDGVVCLTPVKEYKDAWVDYRAGYEYLIRVYSISPDSPDFQEFWMSNPDNETKAIRPVTEVR